MDTSEVGEGQPGRRCGKTGKWSYASQEEALRCLRKIQANPDPVKQSLGYVPIMVYRCRFANHWHLSHKGRVEGVRRRRRKGAGGYW
ncbi:hypothetical protein FE391_46425 [Nonomuraea sp. KC401]|uniref:hypothetical protein n=1 Tax=unclassified Nonomuraea TaxID=2593643 RepID=UPI0010FE2941|nr:MULTISPECIES: hypothetical protein [unclassified Nonomuraea]NBF00545.1 hypothetical protein [Nonomuraea sp. K271]TLF46153.1 hypothetical protein FE391_46425 [Nonomuraea sp. KC401]